MREIVSVTNARGWAQALEACEHNEVLAASFRVMDEASANAALLWSGLVIDKVAFKRDHVDQSDLVQALALAGAKLSVVPETLDYQYEDDPLFYDGTGLHIDPYFDDTNEGLRLWYGASGTMEATFVPLEEGESVTSDTPGSLASSLPLRIASRLTQEIPPVPVPMFFNLIDGVVDPKFYDELEAQSVVAPAGTLLAFGARPNQKTGRLAVAHQFACLSPERISLTF